MESGVRSEAEVESYCACACACACAAQAQGERPVLSSECACRLHLCLCSRTMTTESPRPQLGGWGPRGLVGAAGSTGFRWALEGQARDFARERDDVVRRICMRSGPPWATRLLCAGGRRGDDPCGCHLLGGSGFELAA